MNEFSIGGMTCNSCVAKIKAALNGAGYEDAEVTLSPPRVRTSRGDLTSKKLQTILAGVGSYTVEAGGSAPSSSPATAPGAPEERLTPLFVIIGYITGGVLLRAAIADDFSVASLMGNFMGGFFVVFSLFKLLNLAGFAEAYSTYDLVAARSRAYALSYPFIELALGIAYFTAFSPIATNVVTFLLMSIGAVGVFKALASKRKFQCACLGTALKLPMTKVTLVEDLAMGVMALVMLLHELRVL